MDPELKEILQANLSLAEENNKILHKIRGVQKRETLWQVLKIIVIIGVAFGSFYFLEPYLNKVMSLYNSVTGMEQSVKNVSNTATSLQDVLKKLP